MANTHVEQIRGVGEPARQYMWEVLIPGTLPGGAGGGGNQNAMFTYQAMSTTIPDQAVEVFEMQYKSTKVNFAGRDASTKTFDITFFDNKEMLIYKALWNWNVFCLTNDKSDYALDAMDMELLSRDDETQLKVKLITVFPENVQQLTLDYTANDPVNVPVTFRYDDMEIE